MGSTFGTYGVAYSGMYTSQAALGATSANLSNVNTTGASRVRVASAESVTSSSDGTSQGNGVDVASITRARDALLDTTYRTQNSKNSYLSVKSGNLQYSDKILSEFNTESTTSTSTATSTNSGVQEAIDDFFSSWENLSTDPSTATTREAVVTAGTTLISTLTDMDTQLQQLQADAVTGVKDGVASLNDYAKQVATLNTQITQAESGGSEASNLRDQRDVLLDNMSSLADISTTESNGTLQVTVGGVTLVNGGTSHTLTVTGSGTTDDPLSVEVVGQNSKVTISGGSIAAYQEDADQTGYETIEASDIPYDLSTTATSSISTVRQSLNDLITTLATSLNTVHSSGIDLNGAAGVDFFTTIDETQPLSITNMQVNPLLVADSDKVVTASSSTDSDNTIANKVTALAKDTTLYKSSGLALDITDFYTAVTSWLGTAGNTATSSYTNQTSLVEQVDNQRQAVSSISIDEDMSNMIKFQNAYSASAKVMSTIDSLLGGLISDIGDDLT